MTENERWAEVCKPALDRIDRNVSRLVEVVITGNGKPPLTQRVDALEHSAPADSNKGSRRKSVKVGPVEINGYQMSDIIKAAVLVALLACVWLFVTDRRERLETLAQIKAGAPATAKAEP